MISRRCGDPHPVRKGMVWTGSSWQTYKGYENKLKLDRERQARNRAGEPKPIREYVPHSEPPRVAVNRTQIRPGQGAFRRAVLARDERCVVTGVPANEVVVSKGKRRPLVHAAHIKPVSLCSDGEYWDLDNGLALTVSCHAGFDHGLFTIEDDGSITPHPMMEEFYPPKIIGKLTDGQREYLKGHRKWFNKNINRR